MDTAIAAIIIIALVLFGMLTLAQGYLSAQDDLLESWRTMEGRIGQRSRTSLGPIGAQTLGAGDAVQLTIRNTGNVRIADFAQWDLFVQYDAAGAHHARWYPYVQASPTANQWTVSGIYQNAAQGVAEANEPGILNPSEEMTILVVVSPPILAGSTNVATISTPNGTSASTVFTR